MATVPQTPQEQALRLKPKLSLLRLKSYSTDPDVNSPSCSTPRSNVSWADNCHDVLQADTQQHDKMAHYGLPAPCIFKLMQVVTTAVCTGLYSEGLNSIPNNITTQLFPYIICSIYLIITPVILFSYVIGHRMPELIVRIFNTLGGILFLVAGVVALEGYSFYLVTYKLQLDNYSSMDDIEAGDEEDSTETLDRQGVFLLVLACTVMGLYINAPITTTSSKLIQFLNPAVLGGYIIIIAGLIIGLIINEQVPRKMDMLYMTGGFILFIAAGSMQIYFHGTRSLSHTKDKDIQKSVEFITAAFTIITAFVFLLDTVFTYTDDYRYETPHHHQHHHCSVI